MPRASASHPAVGTRRRTAVVGLGLAAAGWLVAGLLPAAGLAAATTWSVSMSPSTIDVGAAATITVTFSNLGGPSGESDLGCVSIAIPAAFTVSQASVTHDPSDTTWLALVGGHDDGRRARLLWRRPAAR